MSVFCYAEDTSVSEVVIKEQVAGMSEPLNVEKASIKKPKNDEFCVAETFNDLMSWFADKFEFIEEKYLNDAGGQVATESVQDYDLVEDKVEDELKIEPKKPLDLSIPDVAHEGTMKMESGLKATLPNLFVEQEKPYVKEKPSASFGGRILLDDDELEDMQEYRLRDVSGAVRGAEVSLEFKTN